MSGIILLYLNSCLCFLYSYWDSDASIYVAGDMWACVHIQQSRYTCRVRCRCINVLAVTGFSCVHVYFCLCALIFKKKISKISLLQRKWPPELIYSNLMLSTVSIRTGCFSASVVSSSEERGFIQLPGCLFQYLTSFLLSEEKNNNAKAKRKAFSYQTFPPYSLYSFCLILSLCGSGAHHFV